MSKAQRIRELYAKGDNSDGQLCSRIAAEVGCGASYVRVVARQRIGGESEIDRKYRPRKNAARRKRYASDPEYRQKRAVGAERWKAENRERHLAYQRSYNSRVRNSEGSSA